MWTLTPYNPKDDPLGRYTQLKLNGKLVAKLLNSALIIVDNYGKDAVYFTNLSTKFSDNKQSEGFP